jgi:hypothetical protein
VSREDAPPPPPETAWHVEVPLARMSGRVKPEMSVRMASWSEARIEAAYWRTRGVSARVVAVEQGRVIR